MPKSKPQPTQVQLIPSTDLTLGDWKMNPELVNMARKILASRDLQLMIAVVRNESPSRQPRTLGCTHDDQIGFAWMEVGYALALNNFEALKDPIEKRTPLEATFAPEKKP